MQRELQGHYAKVSTVGESVLAFVPAPLPPDPSIDWTPVLGCRHTLEFPVAKLADYDENLDELPASDKPNSAMICGSVDRGKYKRCNEFRNFHN